MGRLTGRTDDMLVIRGVNVFPSQIESVLVGIRGVAPHYLLVVDRVKSADVLEVQVEMTEDMFSDTVAHIVELEKKISGQIKSVVGIQREDQAGGAPVHSPQRGQGQARHRPSEAVKRRKRNVYQADFGLFRKTPPAACTA